MKINKLLASLTLVAAAVASNAVQASLFTVNTNPYINNVTVAGTFSDTYNFTIATPSYGGASVTNSPLSMQLLNFTNNLLDFSSLNMSIYFDSNSTPLASSSVSGQSVYSLLAVGNYHAIVSGTTSGIAGGNYTIAMASAPAPVPAPATLWLLGSGLISLVGVVRRRKAA